MSTRQETYTVEDRKREIIRLVAESLQAENDRASDLELIVRKANISTAEVMEHFGSVNQLLMQMMTALADSLLRPLDDHPAPEASLETVLLAFGENLANAYRNSYLTGLYRIALTEAPDTPAWDKNSFSAASAESPDGLRRCWNSTIGPAGSEMGTCGCMLNIFSRSCATLLSFQEAARPPEATRVPS